MLVASPRYLERAGAPGHPNELPLHALVAFSLALACMKDEARQTGSFGTALTVENQTKVATTVYVSFGSDSKITAPDWSSFCTGAGLRYKSEEHAVVIMAPGIAHGNFETRFFSIDPRLFTPSLRKRLSEL